PSSTLFPYTTLFRSRLEAGAEAQCYEVTVNRSVVLAAEEVGIGQVGGVSILVLGLKTQTHGLAAFLKVGARTRRVAVDVVRPGDARTQVDASEYVRVIPDGAGTVAPGAVGGEAVVVAVLGQILEVGIRLAIDNSITQGRLIQQLTGTIGQSARTKHRITTVAGFAGVFQAANEGH